MGRAANRHWVEDVAEGVEKRVKDAGRTQITCASGVSPSGPIHLGNLREVLTSHFVAEELRRRGNEVRHIHSWDDFDRLRKVPGDAPAEYEKYIGYPLCDVPDPEGEFDSYASRSISRFSKALDAMGVRPVQIRQSEAYRRGDYLDATVKAMAERGEIFNTLADFQTGNDSEEKLAERRAAYFPLKMFCDECHRDSTSVTEYDVASRKGSAKCQCGHSTPFDLNAAVNGKLVWKVDWPMRWAHEGVDFEPGGEDHSSPQGSYSVGKRLVREVFGGVAPEYVGYSFVGAAGSSKLSSSSGQALTPGDALAALEPSILRWLYARRAPNQRIVVDFGSEVVRLYDEMDGLRKRIETGKAKDVDAKTFELAAGTVEAGPVPFSALPVSFRLLSSVGDVTQGNEEQMLRIVRDQLGNAGVQRADLEPRFSCSLGWLSEFVSQDERTQVRDAFSPETHAELTEEARAGITLLLEKLDAHWSLDGLKDLVYGVPKMQRGLAMDTKPDAELKASQREFFRSIYQLLCASDTGPRLPTFLFSLGEDKVRALLAPAA